MRAWIFQGKPERYPLQDKLVAGQKETWLVSRFRNEIFKDDIVLFWSSGNESIRGLYGWGKVTQKGARYFEGWGYGIEILYEECFKEHVGITQIRESKVLNNNVLLKMPIGTNFKLSKDEYEALSMLLTSKGHTAPPALKVED